MKSIMSLAVFTATVAAQAIQFRNTSFTGTFTVGSVWPVSWTAGNGSPVTLTIGNSSWNIPIFVQQPVLPSTYLYTLSAPAGFVSGVYQLALSQLDNAAGTTYSPYFTVLVPAVAPANSTATITPTDTGLVPTATGWTPVKTITVTWVYFDDKCGCTRTTSTASPIGTGVPCTTYSWYEELCGCTKSAVVPVAPTPNVGSNYTAPTVPPVNPAPAPTSTGIAGSGPSTAIPKPYNGDAVKMTSSTAGLIALLIVALWA